LHLAPSSLYRKGVMAKIDVSQINENRRVMEDSTIDSPYVTVMSDTENDIPERLFDSAPEDRVGFMPANEKNRGKR
jgi:hypothetical protein